MWLPEAQAYLYKARIYSPTLGRFLQTDPVGYGDGLNVYAYVANDPVNNTDPTGMQTCGKTGTNCPLSNTVGSEPDGQSIQLPLDSPEARAGAVHIVGALISMIPHPVTKGAGAIIQSSAPLIRGRETSVPVTPNRPDFIVSSQGTVVPTNQAQARAGFDAAGFPSQPTNSPGTQHTLPNGNTVRLMEPSGAAPRRASFENSNGGPVNSDGRTVQPPRGLTPAERREYVRARTHQDQY
ncbi:hypothetical protein D3C86_1366050 [compost metagenome]